MTVGCRALVLTAGLGHPSAPAVLVRAKAALPVAGEPLVRRILRSLRAAGISDVVLNLHHLPAHASPRVVGDGSRLGMRVRYSWEAPVARARRRPRRALPLLDAGVDVSDRQRRHADRRRLRALSSRRTAHRARWSRWRSIPNREPDEVRRRRWSTPTASSRGFVARGSPRAVIPFIGVQVAEADGVRAAADDDVPSESCQRLYPALIASTPGSVRAFRMRAPSSCDIGTPPTISTRRCRSRRAKAIGLAGAGAAIGRPRASSDSVLWDDVVVEARRDAARMRRRRRRARAADTSWHGVTMRVRDRRRLASDRAWRRRDRSSTGA